MERVPGIGGLFFRAKDPKALNAWYAQHLGLRQARHRRAVAPRKRASDPEGNRFELWEPKPAPS